MSAAPTKTTHRFLGSSGLLVSKLALGSWMRREDLVISTKLFFGYKDMATAGPNDQGNTRKHILEGVQASLRFLELESYSATDLTHSLKSRRLRAMNYVINKGWAFYWGTSELPPSQIHEACEIADRLNQIRPMVEQSRYNIFERSNVEYAFIDLYKKYKLGLRWRSVLFQGSTALERRMALASRRPSSHRSIAVEGELDGTGFVDKITPELKAKIDAIDNFVPTVPEIHPFEFARSRFL
ncbi:hypothetical protein PI125_g23692 [Phytophthora idaei]|nr:hypothetical protein PI125_g23692 [Phytophthora idaei]